jgi:hypothetical protein
MNYKIYSADKQTKYEINKIMSKEKAKREYEPQKKLNDICPSDGVER